VRYRLKKDHGIEGGIPVVFSLEKPKAKLLPFQASKEEETPSDYQVSCFGRRNTVLFTILLVLER
jgi:tRNA A37 threonylcarbamoyladenosine dehydratase